MAHLTTRHSTEIQQPSAFPYPVPLTSSGDIVGERNQCRLVLGMRVDGTSYTEATALILRWAEAGESRYVCEAPVHMVMEAYDSPEYQAMINGADLVTPGGMPLVWMLRALGLRKQLRVYGPQLMIEVCRAAAAAEVPVGFYGGTERALTELVRSLSAKFSGLNICYHHAP